MDTDKVASVFCSCAHPHAELCGLWSEEHGGAFMRVIEKATFPTEF